MQPLLNKIVWVTGAGSGIGEAAALTLAKAGGAVVLTGRRREPLETVANRIRAEGGTAHVEPGDLMDPDAVKRIGAAISDKIGHLDILVNNAGVNINERHWDKLTPENAKLMINANLAAAAQCVTVALPLMRAQQDGLIIHTASMAGRFIGGFPGPLYTAAKHGVVAMSHSINMQECVNGIRSCVFLPGEVATPILDQRPNPVGPEERARMVQPQDCADLILYIALLPKRLTMNEVMLSPTWNRLTLRPSGSSQTFNPQHQPSQAAFLAAVGIPTVTDRVALGLSAETSSPCWNRCSTRILRLSAGALGDLRGPVCAPTALALRLGPDIDIKNFVLLKAVRKHTDCPWVLLYIERWLKARAMRDDGMLGLRERGSTGDFSTRSRQVRVSCCRLQVVGLDLVRSARHNLLRGDNGVVLWGYGWVDRWSGPLT